MADLLDRLPGDIPGLLRRGSPVIAARSVEVAPRTWRHSLGSWFPLWPKADEGLVCWDQPQGGRERHECPVSWRNVDLDLVDPNGPAHAAWWLLRQGAVEMGQSGPLRAVMHRATTGTDLNASQLDTLARAVLAVAGREAG